MSLCCQAKGEIECEDRELLATLHHATLGHPYALRITGLFCEVISYAWCAFAFGIGGIYAR